MQANYKIVQSATKPAEIDITSSPTGVYVRRNIKEKVKETETGDVLIYYEYQEAFLTPNEYEKFSNELLVGEINGDENSAEFEIYKNKPNTPVKYSNGKSYKPKWISLYSGIIDEFAIKIELYQKAGGEIAPIMALKTAIYDVTGKSENAVMMTIKEIIELWLFLYQKKEQYFAEYKASLLNLK